MLSASHTLRGSGILIMQQNENWLDRAVEDKLQEAIDRIRAKGQDVHSVGALRKRIQADIEAMRGTIGWTQLANKYNPPPRNELRWCCVCERPVTSGAVTAFLTNRMGDTFCSIECQQDEWNHPITFAEWKQRVKDQGKSVATRRVLKDGQLVDGEQISVSWDRLEHMGNPLADAAHSAEPKPMIDWDSDE